MNNCLNCANFDGSIDRWTGNGYCNKKGKYVNPNSQACNDFVNKPGNGYKPGGCDVTAILSSLGFADNCIYMEAFRTLRSLLLKDKTGQVLLYTYDMLSPALASGIYNDAKTGNITNIKSIFEKYIKPFTNAMKEKRPSYAVLIAQSMFKDQAKLYGITPNLSCSNNEEEIKEKLKNRTLGHAR